MAKKINNLWPKIISWDCLLYSWRQARKGKRYKPAAMEFAQKWEENLLNIHNHLIWGTWRPMPLSTFPVFTPKYRIIEAPAFQDRIVHHAMYAHLEPVFDRSFIFDSYACRKNKGIHRAAFRVQNFLKRAHRNWGQVYVLQGDIASYFPSILHGRLLRQIAKKIKDRRVMQLWKMLLRSLNRQKGLPIGALVSQLGANIYLDAMDHLIKDELGEKYYTRYMDDWLLLSPSKSHLWSRLELIKEFLLDDLGLSLNPKTRIFPAKQGVDFAGYRVWRSHILPRKRNVAAARRRIKKLVRLYEARKIALETLQGSTASFLGYSKHCAANYAVENVLKELPSK